MLCGHSRQLNEIGECTAGIRKSPKDFNQSSMPALGWYLTNCTFEANMHHEIPLGQSARDL